jgi:hypothetical protein
VIGGTETAPRADRIAGSAPAAVGAAVTFAGILAAVHYHALGLTLSHYDARAHLVVARRVLDSLTPGWQQVGAVWLPLPHLLNLVPVQIDAFYRSGASGVAISILSMAVAAGALTWIVQRLTGSPAGGIVAAALLMLNPDVLYLQSTPMTEPLLFGTTFLAVALVAGWAAAYPVGSPPPLRGFDWAVRTTTAAGWACVAAVLTRYEAWPIVAAAIALAFVVLVRRGVAVMPAFRAVRGLALWPMWAIAAFLVNSKITVGAWFVSSGFFVPENPALGRPWFAWIQLWHGLHSLIGRPMSWIAVAAALWIVVVFFRSKERSPTILVLALAACAALPWAAYLKGHPFRIRYDVPLVAAAAAIIGTGLSLVPRRPRLAAVAIVLAVALIEAHPLDRMAPMVLEAQLDARNTAGRRSVTAYLQAHWDGEPILASMGSLAHYMHDLSYAGFDISDFVHEGNGELWKAAFNRPGAYVEWVLIEERAEGGDMIFHRSQADPNYLAGFDRLAEGGNVALYRRRSNSQKANSQLRKELTPNVSD